MTRIQGLSCSLVVVGCLTSLKLSLEYLRLLYRTKPSFLRRPFTKYVWTCTWVRPVKFTSFSTSDLVGYGWLACAYSHSSRMQMARWGSSRVDLFCGRCVDLYGRKLRLDMADSPSSGLRIAFKSIVPCGLLMPSDASLYMAGGPSA